MEEIAVSVLCATYNQEKYIRHCLEGFVMQKTNFPFEVIVNDDASTDRTAEIIKEYSDKYPNIIKPIYQKENLYSKGVPIISECLFPKTKGKYLAFCEGDDLWTDENKLQLQYDIMEKYQDCHLCVHKVKCVSETGEDLKKTYPNFDMKDKLMDSNSFLKIIALNYIHTSSYFIRTEDYKSYINGFIKIKKMYGKYGIGDYPILLYFGQLNKIYYLNKTMSKYRMFSLGSWTSKDRKKSMSKDYKISKFNDCINIAEEFDKYTLYKYSKICNMFVYTYILEIIKVSKKRLPLFIKYQKRLNLIFKILLLIHVFIPNFNIGLAKLYTKFSNISFLKTK